MKPTIRSQGACLSPLVRSHVERHVDLAVRPFDPLVADARVWLVEIDGPRGSRDASCRIVVRLRGAEPVVASAIRPELLDAIEAAADRIRGPIVRSLSRARRRTPRPFRPELPAALAAPSRPSELVASS